MTQSLLSSKNPKKIDFPSFYLTDRNVIGITPAAGGGKIRKFPGACSFGIDTSGKQMGLCPNDRRNDCCCISDIETGMISA